MPFHPLADLFPLPSEDELRALADDIADHGLREPIVTLEGKFSMAGVGIWPAKWQALSRGSQLTTAMSRSLTYSAGIFTAVT